MIQVSDGVEASLAPILGKAFYIFTEPGLVYLGLFFCRIRIKIAN